jgi:hypothetical protein
LVAIVKNSMLVYPMHRAISSSSTIVLVKNARDTRVALAEMTVTAITRRTVRPSKR